MTEEKRLFPAQEKSEKVLDIIRKHWFVYFLFWFLAFIMLVPFAAMMIFWISSPESFSPVLVNIAIVLGSIYLLFILGLLIYGFIDFYLDVYVATDRRIVDIAQNGLFKRTISELNVTEIQDVNAEVNGFMATLLHFGNVHIQTAGEKPNFVFESVPHPYEISKKILDLHEIHDRKQRAGDRGEIEKEVIKITRLSSKEDEDRISDNKYCYSDETCNQKILEGIDEHIKEDPGVVYKPVEKDKEGELKEGEEIELH